LWTKHWGSVAEFEKLYSRFGRPSNPPERLLRALLLQAFYSARSEKQLIEQLDYNLLFRWWVGLSVDAAVWDKTVFTKNRERLIEGDIARKFMAAVLNQGSVKALLSDDHFSVDGTLIEAWARMKSFRPNDGSGELPAPGRNSLPRRNQPPSRLYALAAHLQTRRGNFRLGQEVAGLHKMRHRGLLKVDWQFTLAMAAYDLVRVPKMLAEDVQSVSTHIAPCTAARQRPFRPTQNAPATAMPIIEDA
jgi:transposase